MVNIKINGKDVQVPEGMTVLQAATEAGVTIPTLCDHPDLHPFGGCRLCVVDVKGWRTPMASCTLPVSEGMEVETHSAGIEKSRKTILELFMSNYHDSEYEDGQKQETQFMHWVEHYGLDVKATMAPKPHHKVNQDANPFVWVDLNKCIQCTRCVRACTDIQGRFVWSMAERGFNTHPVPGADTDMIDARCESCGACVAYCPTGALDNKMSMGAGKPDRLVMTTCTYCGVGCQFEFNIKDEKIVRVTSTEKAPVNGNHLCVKGRYGYDFVHHPDRLMKPKVRRYLLEGGKKEHKGSPWEWVETEWDVALDLVAKKFATVRDTKGADKIGVLTSAKCLNEENYLMNKLARQVIGTNNIDHCARL
ncbi:MAG TPA: 2Fe-2S iron-sulfur cluster-binding protein [Anaerolineales bacterium]|nr:2Fe-2S iron-sulfur cluster-binding protein [Anaerolineales bacterium]